MTCISTGLVKKQVKIRKCCTMFGCAEIGEGYGGFACLFIDVRWERDFGATR